MRNRIKRFSAATLCAIAFLGQVAQAQSPDLSLPNTAHSSGSAAYQATNSITTASGFIANGSASVTFTAGQVINLKPGFQATAGSAAVTFRANIGTVAVTETISTPAAPSGPASGGIGATLTYTASGAASNLGHAVQYRFDWGDGSNSGWLPSGTVSASHAWTSPGAFQVTVQARCASEIGVVSAASSLSVTLAPPDFTLSLSAASSTIVAGISASFTVTVASLAGFNGSINLETAGVPGGAAVTFTDPATGLSSPTLTGSGVRTMTVATRLSDMGGAVGNFAFILTARSGSLAHSAALALTVQDYSVTFSKSLIDVTCSGGDVSFEAKAAGNNGWATPVQFSFEGFWSAPNSLTGTQWPGPFTVQIVPVDSQTATFHLHLNPWAPWAGCMQRAFWMKIKGVSSAGTSHVGWSALATNSAGGPSDYRITLPSPSQNISGPGIAQYPVWVESMGAYIGPVSLEVIGLPAGASVTFLSPNPVNLAANTGIATLALNVGSGVPPGTYSFTVRSPGGAGTHSATGSLAVGQGGPRQQTITTSPPGLTVFVNGTACTAPCNFQWEAGTSHTVWTSSVFTDSSGAQIQFANWSDNGSLAHTITAGAPGSSLTASFSGVVLRAKAVTLSSPPAESFNYSVVNDNTQTRVGAYCIGFWWYGVFYCDASANGQQLSNCSSNDGVTVQSIQSPSASAPGNSYSFDLTVRAGRSAPSGARSFSCTYRGQTLDLGNAFDVYDATPHIDSILQDPPAIPGGPFEITLYGRNFGTQGAGSQVSVCFPGANPCQTADVVVSAYNQPDHWIDTQIRAAITPSPNASGTYDVQVISGGVSGQSFTPAPQSQTSSQSNRGQISVTPLPAVRLTSNGSVVSSGQCAYLSATPTMPELTVRLVRPDGQPVTGTVTYRLTIEFDQTLRDGTTHHHVVGNFVGPLPERPASEPFQLSSAESTVLGGGVAKIQWTYNGVQQTPFEFCVRGVNPTLAAAEAEMTTPDKFWFLRNTAIHETGAMNFCNSPGTNNLAYCNNHPERNGLPVFGPPGGVWNDAVRSLSR